MAKTKQSVAMAKARGKAQVKSAPVALNQSSSSKPSGIRIRETERIGTVAGAVGFSATSFAINPALATTFPWLASVAGQFEKYKFHKLMFRYKNMKGTAASGNIILSHEHDALDVNPSTSVAMTQSTNWCDGAPWISFSLDCHQGPELFTRAGSVAGSDLKTYDHGKLVIGVEGCADSTTHGYLEVMYDVELMYKQPSVIGGISTNRQASQFSYELAVAALGTSPPVLAAVRNPLSATIAPGTLVLPAGSYVVTLISLTASALGSISLSVNGTPLPATSVAFTTANPTGVVMYIVDLLISGSVGILTNVTAGGTYTGQMFVELL